MHEQASKDSRRAFMKAIAGGLAVSLPILKGGQASGMGVYEDCLAECYADYVLCCYAASRQPWHIRTPARVACAAALSACYAACTAGAAQRAIVDSAQWLFEHPEYAVIGATVVIGGVVFIVVTGPGGALILVPAL